MRITTSLKLLFALGLTLVACTNTENPPASDPPDRASPEYVTKDVAVQALVNNGGVVTTAAGKQIPMAPDGLCSGPRAHILIPEGFTAVPNQTHDGFLLVPLTGERVVDDGDGDGGGTFKCSGCTTGCAPTATKDTIGCTAGCSECTLTF